MADKTVAKIGDGQGGEFGRVSWIEDWDAYACVTEDGGANGPFDTAEDAGEALADELEPFKLGGAIDAMLRKCREHDADNAA